MRIVADNLQAIRPEIYKAIDRFDPEPIQELVIRSVEAGVDGLDINPGPLGQDPEKKMVFLVETVQEVTDKTLFLDTTNPIALRAGLKVAKNSVVINGFSLEPKKVEQILPLALQFDADIVGYLLLPNGHVPTGYEERLNIAVELYSVFQGSGLPPEKLIIDPVVVPAIWEDGLKQNQGVLSVIQTLPDVLGLHVKTVVGLSNLSAGNASKEKKRLLEMAYLPMLAYSGVSTVLLNAFRPDIIKIARSCALLLSSKIFTWEEIP